MIRFTKLTDTLHVCSECGAVVADKRTHERWHKSG